MRASSPWSDEAPVGRDAWDALQGSMAGEVALPGSTEYEAARKPAIANHHDVRPRAVVMCEAPEDVSEAILFARRHGLRAVPRSGGHCFAGRSTTEGMIIGVSPMDSVSLSGGVATIGAGARLGGVYDALDAHGLTVPAGCGPTVGISGLALGGGLGILGRKHGLTSDRLLGAQVVLADGSILRCDEHDEPDLFWALRGAGGGFGVVTSLAFETVPAPDVTVFHLTWPSVRAAVVIDAWQRWAPAAPDEMAASLLVVAPPDPARPPVANLFGAMLGTEPDARELLDGLSARAGAAPDATFLAETPFRDAKRYLADLGDRMAGEDDRLGEAPGEPPRHLHSKSGFFRRVLPKWAIEALMDNLAEGRVAGELRELDFTPWGGAYNRVAADATAFAHRGERYLIQHAVVVDPAAPADEERDARRWLERSRDLVRPWGSGGVYPNFPDPDLEDWARAYHGVNLERLVRVKRKYDPDNFFRFRQSVPYRAPAGGSSA